VDNVKKLLKPITVLVICLMLNTTVRAAEAAPERLELMIVNSTRVPVLFTLRGEQKEGEEKRYYKTVQPVDLYSYHNPDLGQQTKQPGEIVLSSEDEAGKEFWNKLDRKEVVSGLLAGTYYIKYKYLVNSSPREDSVASQLRCEYVELDESSQLTLSAEGVFEE